MASAFATILVAGLYCLLSAVILFRVQETTDPVLAARIQEREGGLYGPAHDADIAAYKLERYALRRPDILIVGSARLAALPGEAFSAAAFNAAGAVDSVEQLSRFVRTALALHAPKSILIGLDYWWFHPDAAKGPVRDTETSSLARQLIDPLLWLVTAKISVGEFLQGVLPMGATGGVGALAILDGQGWDAYGRYEGGRSGPVGASAPQLAQDLHVGPSSDALQQLGALLAELDKRQVEVVLMVPPTSSSWRNAIAKDPANRLMPLWLDALRSLGQPIFNFEDAAALGATDCELINDVSGGEVFYLRALDAIGNYGGTALSQGLDRDLISSLVSSNANNVRIVELLPPDAPADAQVRSGCRKDM
ncbi:hypothetical protein [Dongia sp.]|uniref:hypothetical protein n=1 Tax=Dongia sp. TaxID=1977262 RepID=UPI0035B0E59A